jgi:hypothetical protein
VIGKATFSTVLVIDETQAPAGACDDSFGTVTLTQKTNSKNTLVIDYHGFVCGINHGEELTGLTVTGTYLINSKESTGKFAGYNGSGNLVGGVPLPNGDFLGNLVGTIQTP